jgi:translation elongation factor EF-1beta
MAKKSGEQEEVFGEDFNLLDDGMEEFLTERIGSTTTIVSDEESQVDDITEQVSKVEEDVVPETTNDEENIIKEDTESNSNENSSSPLVPYAKYLKEEGILPNFDIEKFDGSIDGLREGMFTEINQGVDAYKNSLPDVVKHLINNYEAGVPLEKLLQIDSERAKYTSYSEDDLSSEDVQKNLVRDYLTKTTKYSQERIERDIQRLVDLQELETEAKSVLPELVAIQNDIEQQELAYVQQQKELAEQNRLQELETLQKTLEATEEIIPGNKMSNLIRQKIFKNLTTPVGYTEQGQPLNKLGAYRQKEPVKTEIILNYIFEATNEFKDWSAFSKSAKRAVISEIENAAKTMDYNASQGRTAVLTKSSSANKFLKEIDNYQF